MNSEIKRLREENFAEARRIGYSATIHLGLNLRLGWLIALLPLGFLERPRAVEWLVIPFMLLSTSAGEYLIHRFLLHRNRKSFPWAFTEHMRHHAYFTDDEMFSQRPEDLRRVLMSTKNCAFFVVFVILPPAILAALVVGKNATILGFVAALLHLWLYEFLHWVYHARPPGLLARSALLRKMSEHHRRHHAPERMAKEAFGLTIPAWVELFSARD